MNYVVIEDRPHKSAVVHRVGCKSTKEQRMGTMQSKVWHGPFGTENMALAAAKRTRLSTVRSCGCCYR